MGVLAENVDSIRNFFLGSDPFLFLVIMPWGTDDAFLHNRTSPMPMNGWPSRNTIGWRTASVTQNRMQHIIRSEVCDSISISVAFPSSPEDVIGCYCLTRYVSAGALV
jgi:hypothetical protein